MPCRLSQLPGRGGRILQAPNAQDLGAFGFGHAAPDSIGLAGSQGPGRALVDHGAALADLFGLVDARVLLAAAFAGGVVEDFDVQAAAGGEQLPVPVVGRPAGRVGGRWCSWVAFRASAVKRGRGRGWSPGRGWVRGGCGTDDGCARRSDPNSRVFGSERRVNRGGSYFKGVSSGRRGALATMLSTSSPYRRCRVGRAPASRNSSGSATGRICL